jgi:hypothetical protein
MIENQINELVEINTDSVPQNNYQQPLLNVNNANNANNVYNIQGKIVQEKILTLQKGSKVCKKLCIIFGISMGLIIVFLPLSIILQPILFIFVGIGGIGLIYSFIFVTCCNGFIIVNPNEAVVYQYYGRYLGTIKENGYFYGYPLARATRIKLTSKQYNGTRLKVNERDGNPVELGIIVVWRIGDTAKALYNVLDYNRFVQTQSEAAIRYIGCKYPYDPVVPGEVSLRSGNEIINKELKQELAKRVFVAGLIIEDARVTEISYGSEVAKMMLQKQASTATVYAKDAIVKGAVNAVVNSLNEFERRGCQFSNEDKAKYASKMMNTLCTSQGVHKIM